MGDVFGGDSILSSIESGTGDENGVCYNMEVYKLFAEGTSYLKNTYISEDITESELYRLIEYCSKDSVNYWSVFNNCATVASKAWNSISNVKVDPYNDDFWLGLIATPKGLKTYLRTLPNHKEDYSLEEALSA